MARAKAAGTDDLYNKEYRRLRRLTSDLAIRQVSVGILECLLLYEILSV